MKAKPETIQVKGKRKKKLAKMQLEIKEQLEKKTLDKQNLKTQFDNFFLEKPEPEPMKVVEQFSIEDELN